MEIDCCEHNLGVMKSEPFQALNAFLKRKVSIWLTSHHPSPSFFAILLLVENSTSLGICSSNQLLIKHNLPRTLLKTMMENMLKENTVKQINIYNGNLIPVTKTGLFHFPSSSVWGKSSLRFMPSGTS